VNEINYEHLPEYASTFDDDLRWARRQPEYWAEQLKLEAADAVIDALERSRVSRAELARRMGTSPAFVTKILRGHHNWSLETLAKAGVALGLQFRLVPAPLEVGEREGREANADASAAA
jgi:ribosome-binding protein aMBF1 (putative translation factor)